MVKTKTKLAKQVKALRAAAKLSVRELAKLAQIPPSTASHVERTSGHVDTRTLQALAMVFGVSLDWLLLAQGTPPEPAHVARAIERARRRLQESEDSA